MSDNQVPGNPGGPPPVPPQPPGPPRYAPGPIGAAPRPKPRGMPGWAIALIIVGCLGFCCIPFSAGLLLPALAKAKAKAQRVQCQNNLRQIGLAFRTWEPDYGNQFPFNVSTNQGGTRELVVKGADGFDQNSWVEFRVLSNMFNNPRIFVCPADTAHVAAADMIHLGAANVTYVIHSGPGVSDANPQAILAYCPIHHDVLLADGSVQQLTPDAFEMLMQQMRQADARQREQ